MVHVQRIDRLDLPELAPYHTMRRQQEHRDKGLFVAESDKVVQRLLESDFPVVSLLLPEKWLHTFEPLLAKRTEETINVYLLEKKQLESLTGFTFYQGVLAIGKIPPAPSVTGLIEMSRRPWFFAAVEGITNAENLGGLVRNCAAFGVQGLLVDRTSSSPYLRRAVRGSMGTIFLVPAIEKLDLVEAVPVLQMHGVRCIAAHPHTEQRVLWQANLAGDCCIVFGSEGYGITPALLRICDDAVAIPMAAGVDSLNVGSAAAVFLYEASRQRQA
jgi:tRNA G18 (ribose-2'-O)-methylase SpoU